MKLTSLSKISVFFIFVLSAAVAFAQTVTGTPPFSSLGGGPFDAVNLGNLNFHFVMPILNKAGRGIPFNYNLSYDSSVYQIVPVNGANTWTPVVNAGGVATYWGFEGLGPVFASYVNYNTVETMGSCGQNATDTVFSYSNYVYYDQNGTAHSFPGANGNTFQCSDGTSHFGPAGAENVTAGDDSGYTLNLDANNNGTFTSGTVTTRSGEVLNIPFYSPPPQSTAVIAKDTNGNEVTMSNGVYADTLGTAVLTASGTHPNPTTFIYTSPGGSKSYTVNYTAFNVKTAFGCSNVPHEYSANNVSLVTSIVLPDNSQYTFSYEPTPGNSGFTTGRLAQVTLPTGGTISYNYTFTGSNDGINCSDGSTLVLERTVSPGGAWQYTRSGSGLAWTTTVADPNSSQTVINFAEDGNSNNLIKNFYETQRQMYQGSISPTACSSTVTNNCLLLTTFTCYNKTFSNCATATVSSPITQKDAYTQLTNGSISLSETAYDSAGLGLATDDREYGYGVTAGSAPGTTQLVKETIIHYGSYNGSGCTTLGNSINSSPCQVIVQDWSSGSAVTKAQTVYTYDQGTLTSTSGTPQHVSVSGSRGNLTTLSTQATGTPTNLTTTVTYFDTGTPNVVSELDSNNTTRAQTSYVYGTGSCGNSFPTTINEPLGLSRSTTWNCTGGVATQSTDESGNNINATYTDPNFWRPASITDQLSNQTNLSYVGQTAVESALQNFNAGNSAWDSRSTIDGLGRPILSQQLQAQGGSNYDTTETDYNNVGLPSRTTMPFSATAGTTSSSAPGATTTYDALGRVLTVTDANGGQVAYTYSNNDILQKVSGSQTFQKQFEYDGLGRLSSVCEITGASGSGSCAQTTSATGYLTKYTYDALGHIITVTQNTQGATQQTRSFAYDLLGRMTSETNPESGTTTYLYGSPSGFTDQCYPGGFADTGDLHQKTDANGNYVCYIYDALHRLTDAGSALQSSTNPCKRFRYDSASNGFTTAPSGFSASPNAAGRLIEATTDNCGGTGDPVITDEWFSYDKRGGLTDLYESTPHSGGYYHTTTAYFANGALQSIGGVPSRSAMTYGLDKEGRLSTAVEGTTHEVCDSSCSSSSTTYNTASQPLTINIGSGSGDNDTYTYDPNTGRVSSYKFTVGSTPKSVQGTLTWNSNGTLGTLAIADGFNSGGTQTCSYGHDDLARISSVNCVNSSNTNVWAQNFTYDAFGNLTKQVPTGDTGISWMPGYNQSTNRYTLLNTSYDADGNLLKDTFHTYTWDVYGHVSTIDSSSCGTNGTCLTYDANGVMVEKSFNSTFTQILYSPAGRLATMSGQTLTGAVMPMPGGAELFENSGNRNFYHKDWLGSVRFQSTMGGRGVAVDRAFAPFGETYAGVTNPSSGPDFTGDQQDVVAGLFDTPNREFHPNQGRWISPDPAGLFAVDPTNPQSWNRYAYALNNPLAFVDPLGLCSSLTSEGGTDDCGDPGHFGYGYDPTAPADGTYSVDGVPVNAATASVANIPNVLDSLTANGFIPPSGSGWQPIDPSGNPDKAAAGGWVNEQTDMEWYPSYGYNIGELPQGTFYELVPVNSISVRDILRLPKRNQITASVSAVHPDYGSTKAFCIVEALNQNNSMGIPTASPGRSDSVGAGATMRQTMGSTRVGKTSWPTTSGSFNLNPNQVATSTSLSALVAPGWFVLQSYNSCMAQHGF